MTVTFNSIQFLAFQLTHSRIMLCLVLVSYSKVIKVTLSSHWLHNITPNVTSIPQFDHIRHTSDAFPAFDYQISVSEFTFLAIFGFESEITVKRLVFNGLSQVQEQPETPTIN